MNEYFEPVWTDFAFGLLFTATWQAPVLITTAWLGSLCTRRAAVRGMIWTACVFGLATAPLVSILFPHVYLGYAGRFEPLHFPTYLERPLTADASNSTVGTLSYAHWSHDLCRALVFIWFAGVAVALARIAASWINLIRMLRLATPSSDPRARAIVNRLVDRPNSVTVLQLNGLMGPICWQMHRPKIILPADTLQVSDAELEMMIQHELAHVRRSDPGLLFLQRLVEVFYWFHPLVWWVALQTARYREFVCDDLVVAAGHRRKDYAQCLGKLAAWYYAPLPMAPVGLGMLWGQHLVLQRVKRLVQANGAERSTSLVQRATFCGAATMIILLSGMLRIEPDSLGVDGIARWTAWPPWTARALDTIGIRVRDYPLDAKRHDPEELQQEVGANRAERSLLKR